MAQSDEPTMTSRRTFLKAMGATAAGVAALSVGAVTIVNLGGDGELRAFAFEHPMDVALWVTGGDPFELRVLQAGEVVERHMVDPRKVTELESQYFRAHFIDAPTAA